MSNQSAVRQARSRVIVCLHRARLQGLGVASVPTLACFFGLVSSAEVPAVATETEQARTYVGSSLCAGRHEGEYRAWAHYHLAEANANAFPALRVVSTTITWDQCE